MELWAGISREERECAFSMVLWTEMVAYRHPGTHLPFVRDVYGTNHRFMQDNDQEFM